MGWRCNVSRPRLYFDYLLRTQFTWESVKLEHTLAWHFYKKETTILFPSPQIFETWRPATRSCPSSSSSSDLVAERPLPVSVTVSTRDPILIPAGYLVPHSTTLLKTQTRHSTDRHQCPIPHSVTLLAGQYGVPHQCELWSGVESCLLHSVECGVECTLESSPQYWVGVVEYWVGAVETGEAQYWYQQAAQRPAWSHSYSRGSF